MRGTNPFPVLFCLVLSIVPQPSWPLCLLIFRGVFLELLTRAWGKAILRDVKPQLGTLGALCAQWNKLLLGTIKPHCKARCTYTLGA